MILDEIAGKTRERINEEKKSVTMADMVKRAEALPITNEFPFETALKKDGISFICEVKKASPSKGIIAVEFPYLQIAREYEQAGASALSVLTEPYYFMGSGQYLEEIAKTVKIPVLRKDFVVDAYQIYEAKVLGASAILCICAILTDQQLRDYIDLAHSLGMSALVEAHSEDEVQRGLSAGARILGVNNRDLQTFRVDMNNSLRLRKMVPEHILFVSESGIKTKEDITKLKANQTDAVLVGESLMRAENKKNVLEELKGNL